MSGISQNQQLKQTEPVVDPVSPAQETGEQTTASMLMKSTGAASSVTGKALSTVSVLYLVNYMTTFGVSIVEQMPKLLSGDVIFSSFFKDRKVGDLKSYGILALCLAGGVGFSWFGNFASKPSLIKQVEGIVYGKKKTQVA